MKKLYCYRAELDSASRCCKTKREIPYRVPPNPCNSTIPNHIWSVSHCIGFTLIELLVVVLIIGILSAVAVPQYQKVVEKSRATQALSLLKTVANAYAAHYQANGEYANSFDELAIDIPWTGNTSCIKNALDVKSNQDWSLQLFKNSSYTSLHVTRINGKYKGAGFVYSFETISAGFLLQQLICYERTNSASFVFDTNLPAGSYCQKLFNGTQIGGVAGRYYTLPY